MTVTNYRRALFQADKDLARHLVKRQKLDERIARLRAVVRELENLCATTERKSFENRVERVAKAHLKTGITESARVILEETFFPMTASQVKETLESRKFDLSRYANPLGLIHTVLKRLVESGDVRVVSQQDGKKSYQWISAADKLLSELQRTNGSSTPRPGGSKENK